MDKLAEIPANVLEPVVRSQIYHLLTLGFSYPSVEMFEIYQDGSFISELLGLLSTLPHLARIAIEEASTGDRVRLDLWGVRYLDFEARYALAFEIGYPAPPCSLYHGDYANGKPRSELLEELSAVYARFGVVVVQGEDEHELPDYLCVELEFLHYLALKQARAREIGDRESTERCLQGQKEFLGRHILSWLPEVSTKVDEIEGMQFYPQLARIALRISRAEYQTLQRSMPNDPG